MIYFDNAATSYPKPLSVYYHYLSAQALYSFNSGRGAYPASLTAARAVYKVREKLARFFITESECVIFTKNCTEALNAAIRGSVKKGSHIVITSLEHNSVYRVVNALSDEEICDYSVAAFSFDSDEFINNFISCLRDNTTVAVCTFSSNVFGVMTPLKRIGEICKSRNIRLIADCAQGAGVVNIDMEEYNLDILCAPGHKGLCGPMGTGILLIKKGLTLPPLLYGGTGTDSLSAEQPFKLPESLEAGTLNNAGIIALGAGIDSIVSEGIEAIYQNEMKLIDFLYTALADIDGIKLYTPKPEINLYTPVISFNFKDYSSEKTAALLSEKGICTRAGLHCAPLAHKTFDTLDTGTVRISPGRFSTLKECERFINVVKML